MCAVISPSVTRQTVLFDPEAGLNFTLFAPQSKFKHLTSPDGGRRIDFVGGLRSLGGLIYRKLVCDAHLEFPPLFTPIDSLHFIPFLPLYLFEAHLYESISHKSEAGRPPLSCNTLLIPEIFNSFRSAK